MKTPPLNKPTVAIIGGGPAGLRAAEVAAELGAAVTIYDAMPSVGRKFLVAGKSGLNLTNSAEIEAFLSRYSLETPEWQKMIETFDNVALCEWAATLGIETFESAGGKIFPEGMKAAPLLRAWVRKLRELGVEFAMRHRLIGIEDGPTILMESPAGKTRLTPGSLVLAMGGASWPQTGSDGSWAAILAAQSIPISPLVAANCGWETSWPPALLAEAEGLPLKNIAATCGGSTERGDLVVTRYGLEGAPVYRLGSQLRSGAALSLDLKPDLTSDAVATRLARVKKNFVREARRRLKLSPAAAALLKHLPGIGPWDSPAPLASSIKNCPIHLTGPRPVAEAISTAGGIAWPGLTPDLELRDIPGVYAAGEMLDWEAPTGGFLLQACFATGHHVGKTAFAHAASAPQ